MKRILTILVAAFSLAAHAQRPSPSPYPTPSSWPAATNAAPLSGGAGLNKYGSLVLGGYADLHTFSPDSFRVGTDLDDTNAIQAAVNAACAAAPAKILFTRVYNISAPITGTVPAGNGITIEGLNRNCGVITSAATGDVFLFAPSGTPSTSSLSTGLRWMTFKDFFVDSSVTRTSGAAFHVQWSDSTSFINVRIGTYNGNTTGPQLAMYDGIYMDKQSNVSVTYPQIYCSDQGFITTGAGGSGSTAYFSFGGYIGGGGYMYGNYTTPSIGIHIAGQNGGFELGDFDCGCWGKYGVLCDQALATGTNHELFIGRTFLDSCGVCGCYIDQSSLYILNFLGGWMSGNGRAPGLVLAPGTGFSPENGCGLYVKYPNSVLHINTSGAHAYLNNADGFCICDCFSFICNGASIYQNGFAGVSGSGEHGIEVQGGSNVLLFGNVLTGNTGASFLLRAADTGTYFGVGGASGSCSGTFSYMVFGNDGGGSGTPQGIEESAASRTPNMFAGFTLGGTGNISNGPFPSQFTLPYNETPTTAGVSIGVNTTPRILLSTGTTAQGWEMDNSAGTYRLAQSGQIYQTVTASSTTLLNGNSLNVNSPGTLNEQGARAVTYSTQAISASAIDWTTKGPFTKTISANTTFTWSGQQNGQTITVYVTNTGSYTVTWPTVDWQGGTAPTQTTGAHTDEYTFHYVGTTIYGSAKQNY